jgi:hypothetical protein
MGNCCGPDAEGNVQGQKAEETCGDCIAEENFTTTFYFDNHRVKISGCFEAVSAIETTLNYIYEERIPKREETTN